MMDPPGGRCSSSWYLSVSHHLPCSLLLLHKLSLTLFLISTGLATELLLLLWLLQHFLLPLNCWLLLLWLLLRLQLLLLLLSLHLLLHL